MTKSQKAVIYARISDDREGEGLGIERQETDCRALAERLGFEVIAVYADNDIGASDKTNKTREQYNRMLEDARKGRFSFILAYSNSRLTRRVREYLDLIDLYREHKVEIRTVVSGDHNLATADGRAVALTLATWDAAEAERISERIKRKNLQRAMSGEPAIQHRRRFGFEADAINHRPDEAQAIRNAVADIISGASITSIIKKWEAEGILTTDGKASWGWAPVKRVLFGWKTAGVRSLNEEPLYDASGKLVMGNWEPIITLEERSAGLAMMERRSRRGVKEGKWLLSDLLRCGVCGGKLYGQRLDQHERSSYSCNSGKTANHLAINAKRLEDHVSREVFEYLSALTFRGFTEQSLEPKTWAREQELEEISERISELMDAHASKILTSEVVFPQIQKLEDQRNELRRERRDFHANNAQPKTHMEAVWTSALPLATSNSLFEDQQIAIRAEVETVIIAKATRGYASRTDEAFLKRIEIVWKQPHYEVERLTDEEWASLMVNENTPPETKEQLWKLFTLEET
ncbi:recombinase family protein [Leucobacter albus]|uniref:Recombinase family protein n=1 Tax=Leucobacter albus TaxID=272210 RepID=A0ABW3TMX4_9MICO